MSKIEYSDLLFEISEKLDVNKLPRLLFMSREEIAKGSQRNIPDVLTLFEELERNNSLGIDRLDTLKEILTQMEKPSLLKKVKEFEIRRRGIQIYLIHFEITGYPCNLIGSQWCDLFTNRTIFCSKSHLFLSH